MRTTKRFPFRWLLLWPLVVVATIFSWPVMFITHEIAALTWPDPIGLVVWVFGPTPQTVVAESLMGGAGFVEIFAVFFGVGTLVRAANAREFGDQHVFALYALTVTLTGAISACLYILLSIMSIQWVWPWLLSSQHSRLWEMWPMGVTTMLNMGVARAVVNWLLDRFQVKSH